MSIDSADILLLLDLGSWCFSMKESEAKGNALVFFFFTTLKHLVASIKTPYTTITHNTLRSCRVMTLRSFCGTTFSKQLYKRHNDTIVHDGNVNINIHKWGKVRFFYLLYMLFCRSVLCLEIIRHLPFLCR